MCGNVAMLPNVQDYGAFPLTVMEKGDLQLPGGLWLGYREGTLYTYQDYTDRQRLGRTPVISTFASSELSHLVKRM